MTSPLSNRFVLEHFGPIEKADVEPGDLTVLIGPQASGKSLFLQALKWHKDAELILGDWYSRFRVWPENVEDMLRIYFGEVADQVYSSKTRINGKGISLLSMPKIISSRTLENVVYIPSNRGVFTQSSIRVDPYGFTKGEPYWLNRLAHILQSYEFTRFDVENGHLTMRGDHHFWEKNAIFYGEKPFIKKENLQKKWALQISDKVFYHKDWSTGQQQYLPIAVVSDLLLNGDFSENKPEFVVIEEPELGLHPKAIQSFLLQVFRLLEKGFRVILSTHSEYVLETMWVLNLMAENQHNFSGLAYLFGLEKDPESEKIFKSLAGKTFRTYYFSKRVTDQKVNTKDISSLDVSSEDPDEEGWGGFLEFKDRASAIVAQVVQLNA